jgi:hypothetical protein
VSEQQKNNLAIALPIIGIFIEFPIYVLIGKSNPFFTSLKFLA